MSGWVGGGRRECVLGEEKRGEERVRLRRRERVHSMYVCWWKREGVVVVRLRKRKGVVCVVGACGRWRAVKGTEEGRRGGA